MVLSRSQEWVQQSAFRNDPVWNSISHQASNHVGSDCIRKLKFVASLTLRLRFTFRSRLDHNNLIGTIPKELGNLPSLKTLCVLTPVTHFSNLCKFFLDLVMASRHLDHNKLNGTLPFDFVKDTLQSLCVA